MNELKMIERKIYVLQGMKVMLDSDLADIYGVEVKRLNEQVRRNSSRFPDDFMFQLNINNLDDLRSQFATTNRITQWNHMTRAMPYAFTENGIAMLSSVLKSEQAIQVNISIMRIFTKLRSFHLLEQKELMNLKELETKTSKTFQTVFERLDEVEIKQDVLEKKITPALPNKRKKIGLR